MTNATYYCILLALGIIFGLVCWLWRKYHQKYITVKAYKMPELMRLIKLPEKATVKDLAARIDINLNEPLSPWDVTINKSRVKETQHSVSLKDGDAVFFSRSFSKRNGLRRTAKLPGGAR